MEGHTTRTLGFKSGEAADTSGRKVLPLRLMEKLLTLDVPSFHLQSLRHAHYRQLQLKKEVVVS